MKNHSNFAAFALSAVLAVGCTSPAEPDVETDDAEHEPTGEVKQAITPIPIPESISGSYDFERSYYSITPIPIPEAYTPVYKFTR